MAISSQVGDRGFVCVTYPTSDRVGFLVAAIASIAIAGRAIHVFREVNALTLLLVGLCLVLSSTAVHVSRIRIEVTKNRISTRSILTSSLEFPPDVTVVKNKNRVELVGSDSDFKYSFPKHLNHGGKLQAALDELLGYDDQAPGPTKP
jgi:hypothetical protein